jgi:hypothetical protein
MAGDGGTRRFVKLWWVLAFMAGASAGALSVTFLGMTDTAWGLAGFGLPAAGVIAALEWFGQVRPRPGAAHGYWRRSPRANGPQMRQPSKARPTAARGQLHAITGRKPAEPPSSAPS